MKKKAGFIKRNGLTLVLILMGLLILLGQTVTGLHVHNRDLIRGGLEQVNYFQYLGSGHFLQSTFENMESEFLQMAIFVILTACLYQKGSSESNPLPEENKSKKDPPITKDSPWPVKKGGFISKLYNFSLSIVLSVLFIISFCLHAYGSWKNYNLDQIIDGKSPVNFILYMKYNRFWFESFQNWQSEFISIATIVFLSIYLRQKGSSQSKPVNMPNGETKD
jgi:hypothetical protein